MGIKERKKTLRNIARLREVERATGNETAALVREELEADLGGTVTRNHAAELLGVSHTALNAWIRSGDIPTVLTPGGRQEVPVPALLDLYERVSEERSSGRRRLHTLEPAVSDARRRAERMRPGRSLAAELGEADPHRVSELRSLAYHRALVKRLRRPMVEEARRRLERWEGDERIDPRHAEAWRRLFEEPMSEIRRAIGADDERGRDLRQNSPLAGLISEPERRKILASVRRP